MMERVSRDFGEHLPPLVLYYDDIEKLVDIFAESNTEVTIRTRDFKLASVKELKGLKENVMYEMTIGCTKPHVSVSFTPNHTWLFSYEDSPFAMGIYGKVKQFLISRRRRLAWLTHSSVLPGIVLGSSAWLLPEAFSKGFTRYTLGFFGLIIFGGLWSWWSFTAIMKRHSTIFPLQERYLSSGFLTRNKDKIILGVITAAISAIATLIITNMFK